MRKYILFIFIAIVLVSCSSIQGAKPGDIVEATVISVTDGDTIKIKTSANETAKVRILSIDTPELKGSRGKEESQPFARKAQKRGEQLLLGKTIYVELSKNNNPYDQYDRLLAHIWLDEETLYQEIMIKEGLARVAYVFEPDTKYVERLRKAEEEAKTKEIGIWSIDGYVNEKGFRSK